MVAVQELKATHRLEKPSMVPKPCSTIDDPNVDEPNSKLVGS